MGLAVAAGALCAYVAPAAAGSGIPEVKAYLNGVDAHSILAPSTLFVKVDTKIIGEFYPVRSLTFPFHVFDVFYSELGSKDFRFHSRSVCRICGRKRRANGTHGGLHRLFARARRFPQVPSNVVVAKILQER